MPLYRVYGTVLTAVYVDVSADNADKALEVASGYNTDDFNYVVETFTIDNEVEEIN